jgi:hypothetical protein
MKKSWAALVTENTPPAAPEETSLEVSAVLSDANEAVSNLTLAQQRPQMISAADYCELTKTALRALLSSDPSSASNEFRAR